MTRSDSPETPRAGLFGRGSTDHIELIAHDIFSEMGHPLEYAAIPYPDDTRGWFEEDVLEPLARVGVLGVDLIEPAYGYGALCTDWDDAANDAGCVDAVSFPDRGDRRPIGTNFTLAAIRALLAHRCGDIPLDLPVLVRGAGVTGSCIVTALLEVAVDSVLVFDPDPVASRELVANSRARGIDTTRLRPVGTDELSPILRRRSLVIDCASARPGADRRIDPSNGALHIETRPGSEHGNSRSAEIGPAEFAAFRAAFSHQEWTRSTIPLATILSATSRLEATLQNSQAPHP